MNNPFTPPAPLDFEKLLRKLSDTDEQRAKLRRESENRLARFMLAGHALQGIVAGGHTKSTDAEIARDAVALGDATLCKLLAGRSAMEAEAWEIVEELAKGFPFGSDVDRFKLMGLVERARGLLNVKEGGGS